MPVEQQKLRKIFYDSVFGVNGPMTIKDFTDAFESILKQILQFEKKLLDKNTTASDDLRQSFSVLSRRMEDSSSASIATLQKEMMAMVGRALDVIDAKANSLTQPKNGEHGADGLDGHTPTKAELTAIIKPLIPKVENGMDGSPDSGTEIIGKINKEEDTLIKKEKVEGLADIELMARSAQANTNVFHNSGSFVYDYDLSDYLNGVLKTFTLPSNAKVITVLGSSAPGIFRKTVDYTTTSSTITFTSAIDASTTLASGQTVVILYKIL